MSVSNLEHDRSSLARLSGDPGTPSTDLRVIDLRGLFVALWRRKVSIVATAFAFAFLAAVIALMIPPKYKATAQLLIDPAGLNVLRNDVTQSPANADSALAEAESQIGVIRSNDVMFEVIRRTGLEADEEFGSPPLGLVGSFFNLISGGANERDTSRMALQRLGESVDVAHSGMTFVINIDVWTKTPVKSARIANAFAEIYLEKSGKARAGFVRRSSDSLSARLEDLRARVNASAERVERYRSENGIVDAGGLLIVDQQLQEATNELSRVNATVTDLESRYEEILLMRSRQISPEILSEVLLSPTIADLRSLLTVAMAQVSTLEATLGPRHPEFVAARSNVALVEAQIRAELDRIVDATRVERDRERARAAALAARVETLKDNVLGSNSAMPVLRELVRQADSDREVYESFLKRAGELSEQQSVDTTNARLISQATAPLKKSWPPRTIIVLAAGMMGGAIGLGQALLREQFDPRLHSAEQVWQETGVPVLAEIPRTALEGKSTGDGMLASLDQFYNQIASAPGTPARWVLFASADAEQLAAMATLSLATSAVDAGDRVMLIDADTRQARLSRLFGKQDEPGLREMVYSGESIGSVHRVSDDGQLQLVPAGRTGSSNGDKLRTSPLRKVLGERNQPVDLILVNAGELWSSRLHRGVASAVDTVVLVAVTSQTRTADINQAVETLTSAGARVGGVMLVV